MSPDLLVMIATCFALWALSERSVVSTLEVRRRRRGELAAPDEYKLYGAPGAHDISTTGFQAHT